MVIVVHGFSNPEKAIIASNYCQIRLPKIDLIYCGPRDKENRMKKFICKIKVMRTQYHSKPSVSISMTYQYIQSTCSVKIDQFSWVTT